MACDPKLGPKDCQVSCRRRALADGVVSGELPRYVGVSLGTLLQGYAAGVLGAFVLTTLAMATRWPLALVTQILVPAALPAIGLLFEHLVFQSVERLTVRRWGMQR